MKKEKEKKTLNRRIDAKSQHIAAAFGGGLDDERVAKLGVAHFDGFLGEKSVGFRPNEMVQGMHHLKVGDGDVEVFGEIRMPDNPDIGDEKSSKVSLVCQTQTWKVQALPNVIIKPDDKFQTPLTCT